MQTIFGLDVPYDGKQLVLSHYFMSGSADRITLSQERQQLAHVPTRADAKRSRIQWVERRYTICRVRQRRPVVNHAAGDRLKRLKTPLSSGPSLQLIDGIQPATKPRSHHILGPLGSTSGGQLHENGVASIG